MHTYIYIYIHMYVYIYIYIYSRMPSSMCAYLMERMQDGSASLRFPLLFRFGFLGGKYGVVQTGFVVW